MNESAIPACLESHCRGPSYQPLVRGILLMCVVAFCLSLSTVNASERTDGEVVYAPVGQMLGGFATAAKEMGIDPLLFYSVALAESARSVGDGNISPWPWALRANRSYYPESREAAEPILARLLAEHKSVDIGWTQINSRWNGHRVNSLADLLDPETSLRIGATILREAIDSSPGDLELGVGRYHNWDDEARARNYGARVLAIRRNLVQLLNVGGGE